MKSGHIGTLLLGIVLLAYSLYAYWSGGIAGRSGSVSVTQERDPVIFWIALVLIALCGAFAFFYGLARTFNFATRFTTRVDAIVRRGGD